MRITSRDNEQIKFLIRLQKSASERKKTKKILLDGARLCYDAYDSGQKLEQLYVTAEAAERYASYLEPILASGCPVTEITPALADAVSDTVRPQGIFALCESGSLYRSADELQPGRYLALERLQDPGNLGTIIRTAAALGADGLLMTRDCVDVGNPKTLRSTMGALFRLPLYLCDDAQQGINALKACGVSSYAAALNESAVPLQAWPHQSCAAFWIGNEGNGLCAQTVEACDGAIIIPMQNGAESLNAAVCASIFLWELLR